MTWDELEAFAGISLGCERVTDRGPGYHWRIFQRTTRDDLYGFPQIKGEHKRYYASGGRSVFFFSRELQALGMNSLMGANWGMKRSYLETVFAKYRPVFSWEENIAESQGYTACSTLAQQTHLCFQAATWPGSPDLLPTQGQDDRIHIICPQNWRLSTGFGTHTFNKSLPSAVDRLMKEWWPDALQLRQWCL